MGLEDDYIHPNIRLMGQKGMFALKANKILICDLDSLLVEMCTPVLLVDQPLSCYTKKVNRKNYHPSLRITNMDICLINQ